METLKNATQWGGILPIFIKPFFSTVQVKSFAHLNPDFLKASLEERGKSWPPPPGGLQKIHEINVQNFWPAL